jgi:hypothetical protein
VKREEHQKQTGLTKRAAEAGATNAAEAVKQIHTNRAGACVHAGLRAAFIDVRLALRAAVPSAARTAVPIHYISARGTVRTGVGAALVHVCFTQNAGEAGGADTYERCACRVHTRATVQARERHACHHSGLTLSAGEATHTRTAVRVGMIHTSSTIRAGLRGTFVDVGLAVNPFVAGIAATAEAVHTIDTSAMTRKARVGAAFIDVCLAVRQSGRVTGRGT